MGSLAQNHNIEFVRSFAILILRSRFYISF